MRVVAWSAGSSSRYLALRRLRRGRSRGARSSQSGCDALAFLITTAAADPAGQARLTAFRMELKTLGWTDGRNIHVLSLWGAAHPDDLRKYAAELVAFAPDGILATGSCAVEPLLQATRSIPIVFVTVIDPAGGGFVESLARPGGHAMGFILFEYGLSGKWLELLKQIAPGATRTAIIRDAHSSRNRLQATYAGSLA
jgi:putative tryptophan/tyrosine transport system substrate-binding protein